MNNKNILLLLAIGLLLVPMISQAEGRFLPSIFLSGKLDDFRILDDGIEIIFSGEVYGRGFKGKDGTGRDVVRDPRKTTISGLEFKVSKRSYCCKCQSPLEVDCDCPSFAGHSSTDQKSPAEAAICLSELKGRAVSIKFNGLLPNEGDLTPEVLKSSFDNNVADIESGAEDGQNKQMDGVAHQRSQPNIPNSSTSFRNVKNTLIKSLTVCYHHP